MLDENQTNDVAERECVGEHNLEWFDEHWGKMYHQCTRCPYYEFKFVEGQGG